MSDGNLLSDGLHLTADELERMSSVLLQLPYGQALPLVTILQLAKRRADAQASMGGQNGVGADGSIIRNNVCVSRMERGNDDLNGTIAQ